MARAATYRQMSPDERTLALMNRGYPARQEVGTALVPARKRQSFVTRNKGPVIAVGLGVGFVGGNRLDLIPFQPMVMGRRVPASVLALAATFLGAIVADKVLKRRDLALVSASLSAGLGLAVARNAIAARAGEGY